MNHVTVEVRVAKKLEIKHVGRGSVSISIKEKLTDEEIDYVFQQFDAKLAKAVKASNDYVDLPASPNEGDTFTLSSTNVGSSSPTINIDTESLPETVLLGIVDGAALLDFETGAPLDDVSTTCWEKIKIIEITRDGSVCQELLIAAKLSEDELNWLCSIVSEGTEKQVRKINKEVALKPV